MISFDLLQAIVNKLNRGGSSFTKWPDPKGEYWALCPFHADKHPTNFSVSAKGFKCFVCGESGGLRKLAEKLEIEIPRAEIAKPLPATLEDYAQYKRLPVEFLKELGLKTAKQGGKQCLRIPYYDESGRELTYRIRWTIGGDKARRFSWKSKSKVYPYGLWRVHACARDRGDRKQLFLVEGESDAQSLWFYGIDALGIPGATNWKKDFKQYLEGYQVYIWQESDEGGQIFVDAVAKDLPDAFVITPPAGRKDVSECHLWGDDISSLITELKQAAIPYKTILAEKQKSDALAAAGKAGSLLKCPDILSEFSKTIQALGVVGEIRNTKLLYLAGTSRVLPRPISINVTGPSSVGKSYEIEKVLCFFPDSAYCSRSSMSEKALAYSDEPLTHRILIIYEAAGMNSDLGSYLLRSLLSEGHIKYETIERTDEGLRPRLIEREGPTGLILSTTWAHLDRELETRMITLTAKDDRNQTSEIMMSLAERMNGKGPADPDLEPWIALQTWIELAGNHTVKIPYAPFIAELANPKAVRLRRDFTQVLNLISAHTILHQMSRDVESSTGRIIANLDDYRAIYELISDLLNDLVRATVSPATRETVDAVRKLTMNGKPASITLVAKSLNIDRSAASRRVMVALDHGYLSNDENQPRKPAKLMIGDPMPEETGILPAPERLIEKLNEPSYPPITPARVHAQEDREILDHAENLAIQARKLDELGDHTGADQLRDEMDLIYAGLDGTANG